MADKKKAKGRSSKKKLPVLGIAGFIAAVIFMPTTILLFFGMLPTVAAGFIDRSGKGIKALTVGAMNLAGCTPFLLELWTGGHTADLSLEIISDPRTIIVIYCAAAMGYLVDWAVSGIVKSLLLQKAKSRTKEIKDRQSYLVKRWGREVTGELPLDAFGFPIAGAVVSDRGDEDGEEPA